MAGGGVTGVDGGGAGIVDPVLPPTLVGFVLTGGSTVLIGPVGTGSGVVVADVPMVAIGVPLDGGAGGIVGDGGGYSHTPPLRIPGGTQGTVVVGDPVVGGAVVGGAVVGGAVVVVVQFSHGGAVVVGVPLGGGVTTGGTSHTTGEKFSGR